MQDLDTKYIYGKERKEGWINNEPTMAPPRTPKYMTVTALDKPYEKSTVKSYPLYEKQKVNNKQDV